MTNKKLDTDPKLIAAMQACVVHARALLQSAQAVQAAGHSNVAYHLAALCLEEIGRRALIGVQSISQKASVPPAWPKKHEQDHVKKLFWCFFGGGFLSDQLTAEAFREMVGLAQRIHDTVDALGAPHVGERTDKELISAFCAKVTELTPQLVTFNGNTFVLPVLRYRAMIHRISAPGLAVRPPIRTGRQDEITTGSSRPALALDRE